MARSYGQRRYARLRRQGLCGTCGKRKSKTATCTPCRDRAKELRAIDIHGKYRCGYCLQPGHTRRRCPLRPAPVRAPGHSSDNDAYRSNRELGLCDRCGCPSRTANCAACAKARKLAPSRQPEYLAVQRAKQDRSAEDARRNAKRRRKTTRQYRRRA